jgi:LDH2 family malate/lactate/ureidoglycolate dehydrogenase
MGDNGFRAHHGALRQFCEQVFLELDVPAEDARITADVLVTADLHGIDSHGVARLRRYVDGLWDGIMRARPDVAVLAETPTTVLIDAGAGLGQPASYRAMQHAIQKAKQYGSGFACVRNSNHFGIAGYYAMMALDQGCIGIAMTNAGPRVLPTFAREAMLGTNPLAVAAPASAESPFVLDMATSTVAVGKLEIYDRLGKCLPPGWAIDEGGAAIANARHARDHTGQPGGGGLLPLGGSGETLGGYKGYGLALLVEILSGVLSGAAYADLLCAKGPDGQPVSPNLGHFFGALLVDAFRPLAEFAVTMDDLQGRLRATPKAAGQDRIYIPGEKEYEQLALRSREGIPLESQVVEDLLAISGETGVPFDVAVEAACEG